VNMANLSSCWTTWHVSKAAAASTTHQASQLTATCGQKQGTGDNGQQMRRSSVNMPLSDKLLDNLARDGRYQRGQGPALPTRHASRLQPENHSGESAHRAAHHSSTTEQPTSSINRIWRYS
jgi:hypothetical protein